MTTFYMSGCVSDKDDAIVYFETRFFAIEQLVELDNRFQIAMEEMVGGELDDDSLDEVDFVAKLSQLKESYGFLKSQISAVKLNNLPSDDDDMQFHRSFLSLLDAYDDIISVQYLKMIYLIENEEDNNRFSEEFKVLYQTSTRQLNERLDVFYQAAQQYCGKHDIPIEWDED